MKQCIGCGKEFKEYAEGTPRQKNFCSHNCNCAFNQRKYYYEGKKKKLSQTNPELYKELIRDHYNKNKGIWHSRMITAQIFKTFKSIDLILPKKCNRCLCEDNLQIHHEIYPTKTLEIIDAILNKKIFYLCIKCHGEKRKIY